MRKPKFRPNIVVTMPPTYLTPAQAARAIGIPMGTVYMLTGPGKPLETELWYGTKMIPAWRIWEHKERLDAMKAGE